MALSTGFISLVCLILCTSVFSIASASIGIQFYNKCYPAGEPGISRGNWGFLIFVMVLNIILFLSATGYFIKMWYDGPIAAGMKIF